jgi:hypothetical protein
LSSDGYATGAVRDLLDLLAGHEEEVTIYCIHDADAYGTGIYQALQDETATRPGRKFEVVNLGLEPDEAFRMAEAGLVEIEQLRKAGVKRKPVAKYVAPKWAEWLQSNRVELNALSTPQFLKWLDAKFAACPGKVVPPAEVMAGRLADRVRADLRSLIARRILVEAGLDDQVDRAMSERTDMVEAAAGTIVDDVAGALTADPSAPWSAPVARIAGEIAQADPSGKEG